MLQAGRKERLRHPPKTPFEPVDEVLVLAPLRLRGRAYQAMIELQKVEASGDEEGFFYEIC